MSSSNISHSNSPFDQLSKIKVGRVVSVELIPDAKYSTHYVKIDFGGEIGVKSSCARLVGYELETLQGRLVLCHTGLEPKQIGKHLSEVLILGVKGSNGECVLISPDEDVQLGEHLY